MEDAKCQICSSPLRPEDIDKVKACENSFSLCGWCQLRVKQYIEGNIGGSVINIYWGAGHVCWSSWNSLREIIRKYNIKEVFEFGTGLSTELFVNEGLDVVSSDVWKCHSELYQRHKGLEKVKFHWYLDGDHFPDYASLYPGKKWDFVFVDGPQERSREVKKAMELSSRFIYLHDPNLGEQDFFPNENWKPTEKGSKLFEKGGI